jgi:hypothetical protein
LRSTLSNIIFLNSLSYFLFSYNDITLFCLVLGEEFRGRFAININTKNSVSTVQELIKERKENALRGVDANNLKLWKVAIPTRNENEKRTILENKPYDQIDIEKDLEGKRLEADDNIGELFDQQLDTKQISIIIQSPPPATTGKCLPMVYLSNKKFALSHVL